MTMNNNGAADRRRSGGGGYHHRHHSSVGHHDKESSDGGRSINGGGRDGGSGGSKYDDPPNSRLFIVCGKQITEEAFREAFGAFGTIEEVWMLKDRVTGEPKGVTYIKFSKTSEAALAMEEMNGRCVAGSPRPLKVLIAHSRDQGSRRDVNEDERLVRLFVVVPKSLAEAELRDTFSAYGDIDYVSIVRDRTTKESKGFAYVKYHRMSHAAKAFEECDRGFKPVFADPKPQKALSYHHDGPGGGGSSGNVGTHGTGGVSGSTASGSTTSASMSTSYDMLSYMDTSQLNAEGVCRLSVSASPTVNQDQVWRLFDLIPGLDYCDRPRSSSRGGNSTSSSGKGLFTVVYNNPQSATYAKEKLHGFEYPPGHRMVVRFDQGYDPCTYPPSSNNYGRQQNLHAAPPPPTMGFAQMSPRGGPLPAPTAPPPAPPQIGQPGILQQQPRSSNIQSDLAHLTETIANATALLQAAGYAAPTTAAPQLAPATTAAPPTAASGETYDPSYCSVKLPPPQPLAAMDSAVAERLFIVCTPVPPQPYALKDVFGRFGSLIDIYMLNGKTCGYAKYAVKESADAAVAALHGQEICGSRLKVMRAEPQQEKSGESAAGRKRPKIASDGEQ